MEMVEIYVNAILYKRNLYPEAIFRARKAYNIPVYMSIYKTLNEYIEKTLRAARELNRTHKLRRLEVLIYHDEEKPKESYVFDFDRKGFALEKDQCMLAFEEELRSSLLALDSRMKDLKPLPADDDVRFKIVLHTTESAFVKIGSDPRLQSFPFVKNNAVEEAMEKSKIQLLPVLHTSSVGIQVYVEEYN
ncbi:AGAP001326-PA-like protein [Anopheles sinensis]|uniref:AGAP001326-PA-like protein n=1 Tax=Anopheles sinensis TaxID=74873 RepID=A0A084VS86_ANOSI|nr:AGAP001326-PA-like protein [Anopheles sinensis]